MLDNVKLWKCVSCGQIQSFDEDRIIVCKSEIGCNCCHCGYHKSLSYIKKHRVLTAAQEKIERPWLS